MRIGLKLNPDFDNSETYSELFSGREVLSSLVKLGVEAVEIPLHTQTDLAEVGVKAQRCNDVGLHVSFHPYTEDHESNAAHFDGPHSPPATMHAGFLALAADLARSQGETIVNIHPAAGPDTVASVDLVERSVAFFSWARSWCADNAPLVRPVAELRLRAAANVGKSRAGETPDELAQIVTGSEVGACWDTGHAVLNHRRFGSAQDPPQELWERIVHVHCHDVDDRDHRVLRSGDSEWKRFLVKLIRHGFGGTVVIEVNPQTFIDSGGIDTLENSIAVLSEVLAVQ